MKRKRKHVKPRPTNRKQRHNRKKVNVQSRKGTAPRNKRVSRSSRKGTRKGHDASARTRVVKRPKQGKRAASRKPSPRKSGKSRQRDERKSRERLEKRDAEGTYSFGAELIGGTPLPDGATSLPQYTGAEFMDRIFDDDIWDDIDYDVGEESEDEYTVEGVGGGEE